MRFIKQSATVSLLLLMLCGCGQRGPLFLPQEPPAENQPTQDDVTTQSLDKTIRGKA